MKSPVAMFSHRILTAILLFGLGTPAFAGDAAVVDAKIQCSRSSVCTFTVTLRHADTGWDHYADRWEVLALDGKVLGTRVLLHPHVGEQPFTRSLPDVEIPASIEEVHIRARDSVHGYGGREMTLKVPR